MKRRIIVAVLGFVLIISSLLAIPLALADGDIPLPIVTDIPRTAQEAVDFSDIVPVDQPIARTIDETTPVPTVVTTAEPTPEPTAEFISMLPTPVPELIITPDSDEDQADTPAAEETQPAETVQITAAPTIEPTVEPTAEPGQEYLCGLEVHVHEDACLDENGDAICGLEEHVHEDACLIAATPEPTVQPEYVCGRDAHSHEDACLDENGDAICGLEEHVHVPECLAEAAPEVVYYCGLEEHSHDDACLDAQGNVACGLEEHVHGPECAVPPFTVALSCSPDTIYIGGMTALFSYELSNGAAPYSLLLQDHMNGELLYEQVLDVPDAQQASFTYQGTVPGEHVISLTVTDSIGALATAQLPLVVRAPETEAEWIASFENIALSGDLRSDLIAIARSQLGYTESTEDYILDADGNVQGFTRYGAWYGLPYEEWCAMFVSFCLNYAGGELPLNANCSDWVAALSEAGVYRPAADYAPVAGDLVFFDRDADGAADHVGILEEVVFSEDSAEIHLATIEGNSGKQVAQNHYTLPDSSVLGYAQLGEAGDKQELIEFVRGRIDDLPEIDEFYIRLEEMIDDPAQMEAYYNQVHDTAADAWVHYQCMSDAIRSYIPNGDKLMEYSFMWDASMFVLRDSQDIRVYTLNYYNNHGSGTWRPVMVYGGTVQEKIPTGSKTLSGYSYWTAIVVEEGENGLYVSRVVPTETEKYSLKANTANGFVLIVHNTDSAANAVAQSVQIGQYVEVSFNYKTAGADYKSNGYGTISFGLKPKADKNNGLKGFRGLDTSDLIKIRMYNYDDTVNTRYSNTIDNEVPYPGFQNPHGESSVDAVHGSSFGDNVTADNGLKGVAGSSKKGLNGLANSADSPLTDAMYKTLVNGYPAMSDGTSLAYLFDDTYRVGGDANYLFQQNTNSGQYWFNCRTNFAEFDGANSFTLYNQTLTPNMTFYPFGNFLPFNRINADSKQVAAIDREYMMSILGSAEYNASMNVDVDQQSRLAQTMRQWILEMDEAYGYDWNWADAINGYMTSASGGKMTDFDAESNPNITEDTLYSLDYDVPTDFFFGMNFELDFLMPRDGWTGKDTNNDGVPDYPTTFSFSGDDDVWVYIDDVLFLDLSGIHRHVGGEINFMDGTVTRYSFKKSNSSAQDQYGEPMTFRQILTAAGWSEKKIDDALEVDADGFETFKDYSEHNLKFYYMERGSGSSICQMGFNMPVLRENAISVGKALDLNLGADDTTPLGSPDFKFQVLKPDGTVMLEKGREYTIYQGDPALGNVIGTGTVGENGIFTLKAGQYAQFSGITEDQGRYFVRELIEESVFAQYGIISISGSSNTTASGTNVSIGGSNFVGYESPILDIATGSTTFLFTNEADPAKFGSLRISKELVETPDALSGEVFDFQVTIDGKLLPVGTNYIVQDATGNQRTDTVSIEGIVYLRHGETAVIGPVLAGSAYSVTELNTTATSLAELAAAQPEYTVSYYVDGTKVNTQFAAGIIHDGTQTAVSVSVENKIYDYASITIPITKTIANPDGKEHTYAFTLQQMVNDLPAGEAQTVNLTLNVGEDKVTLARAFELYYRINEKGTYTYRIVEENTQEAGTAFDNSIYLVTVEVETVGGKLTASITGVEKNGEAVPNFDASGADSAILFENVLADSLTIRKVVSGTAANQADEFTFTLLLRNAAGDALSGTFSGVKTTPVADGDPITEEVEFTLNTFGEAEFTLKHGQMLSVNGLPKGTVWRVTETESHDYKTTVTVGSTTIEDSVAQGTIAGSGAGVVFTNTRLYVLPSTGGPGAYALYLLGATFMLLAGIGLLNINKMRSGYKRCSGK